MNSPTISRGNNHSHPRECISHGGPRPAEGGIEIGPGRWICFHCWSRGLRSAGAFVRREAAANPAPVEVRPVERAAQSVLGTTASAWHLCVPSPTLGHQKQSQSVL